MRSWRDGRNQLGTAAVLISIALTAFGQFVGGIADKLYRLDVATALDATGIIPWHMKMSVQLFDAKGQPGEQGLIEEWWGGPATDRVVYSVPSYKATEVQRGAEFYRSKATEQPPWMLELLREQTVHPMPVQRDVEGTKAEVRKEKFGKAALECIMLTRPIKAVVYLPVGAFPTYCMDAGTDSLRVSYDYGSQMILRNAVEEFQGRGVARDISILRGGVLEATARVFKLEAWTADDSVFAPTSELDLIERPIRVGAATMAATLISKVSAKYPEAAKERGATGIVTVQAVIGRDGHVAFAKLVSAPDADLGEAALSSVRQWVYKPYVLDGTPVEVETTMIVNFTLGG